MELVCPAGNLPSLKAAVDFGLTRTMTPVGLTATLNDIHSLGLEAEAAVTKKAGKA